MISPGKGVASVKVERYRAGDRSRRKDVVAVEEPLEIRVEDLHGGRVRTTTVSVTMRTPGDDFELAVGFLFGEGLLASARDVAEISYCMGEEPQQYNIVVVRLRSGSEFDVEAVARNFYTTSSCGVCGKASLEAVEIRGCEPLPEGTLSIPEGVLTSLPEALRERQGLFDRTGGIHAAGRFAPDGSLLDLKEDVGRHNAVDKVVGKAFLSEHLPLMDEILCVSGRASFEIMQKALAAGVPAVVAVGAPSSLAVDLAKRFNMTLVGFTRSDGFNVYAGAQRIERTA
jgi:FdhD protein